MKKMLVGMTPPLLKEVSEFAEERGMTKSEAMRLLVREGLDYEAIKDAKKRAQIPRDESDDAMEMAKRMWGSNS